MNHVARASEILEIIVLLLDRLERDCREARLNLERTVLQGGDTVLGDDVWISRAVFWMDYAAMLSFKNISQREEADRLLSRLVGTPFHVQEAIAMLHELRATES